MIPPCGVPSFVGVSILLNTTPALSHLLSIILSICTLSASHSWLIWSKHPLISPSNIHSGELFLLSNLCRASMASAVLRFLRKPYELPSAIVSVTGSRASRYNACIALSCMVGIPNGRCFPLLFLINTLLRGLGLYPLRLRDFTALNFEAGVVHFTLSTPAVRFPLLDVTLFTANALAWKEVTRRCCRAFTLLHCPSF